MKSCWFFFVKEKYKIAVCLAVVAIVAFKFFYTKKTEPPEHIKVVETEIVARSEMKHRINLIGVVRPKHYCVLTAKARGTVDTLIPEGSSVKKGDLIAKVENLDIEKTYKLSVSAREIAQRQYDRIFYLAQKSISSKKEADDLHQRLIEADKNLARASIDLENTRLKAPFDGILGAYKVKDGEQISEGDRVASFYNHLQLMVEFEIPSQYVHKINSGQEVIVNGKAAALKHVQKAVDEETHMCPASVEINSEADILIGDSVDLVLTVEEKEKAMVVPASAVFIRNGKDMVYVIKDGKTDLREVEIGLRNRDNVEILKGLDEKDEIVTIAQDRLYPGMSVIVAEKNAVKSTTQAKLKSK
jgi:membrane fusion protein (multidrug efflux system)